MYYKPLTAPTSIKRIIHKNDLNSFIATIRNFSEDFNDEKIAESKIKLHNGRVYKDLGNGYGMYSDNGQVFRLK